MKPTQVTAGSERQEVRLIREATVIRRKELRTWTDTGDTGTAIMSAIAVLVIGILLFGIAGNVAVIHVIQANELMRAPANLFILNLSLADLGLCVVFMPFSAISLIQERWLFGTEMCVAESFIGPVFVKASLLTMSAIVFERYLRILRHRLNTLSWRSCLTAVFLIWFGSGVFSLPVYPRESVYNNAVGNCHPSLSKSLDKVSRQVFFIAETSLIRVLPVITTCYCSFAIRRTLRQRWIRVAHAGLSNAERLRRFTELRTAHTTSLLVICDICLLVPFGLTTAILEWNGKLALPKTWMTTAACMVYANAAVKPIIYASRHRMCAEFFVRRVSVIIDRVAGVSRRLNHLRPYVVPLSAAKDGDETRSQSCEQVRRFAWTENNCNTNEVSLVDVQATLADPETRSVRLDSVPRTGLTDNTICELNLELDSSGLERCTPV